MGRKIKRRLPKPYYQTKLGKLYYGDCFDIIPHLPKVDMVLTDPPYNVNYEGGQFHSGKVFIRRKRKKIINDNLDIYQKLIPSILSSTNGPCYCFYSDSRSFYVYNALHKANADIHAMLIWNKTNATYAAMNAQYKKKFEPIVYFKRKGGNTAWCGKSTEKTILNFPKSKSGNIYHPTQKPVNLLSYLISNHTSKSILDPCLGSGSTAIACEYLDRNWIGIEKEEKYCKIAAKRIQAVIDTGFIFNKGVK